MGRVIYPCGCTFDTVDPDEPDFVVRSTDDLLRLPKIKLDLDEINLECSATWELLGTGHTIGIFQLESRLGSTWVKNIKPHNISELADVVALIRPSCLKGVSGDPPKSMTERYTDRKNGKEEDTPLHESLSDILKDTHYVLLYQESCMQLAQKLAGFNLQEADILRRAMGHKDTELMSKVEKDFLEGCKKTGIVDEETAKEIFSWVKAAQKYNFNKSVTIDSMVKTKTGDKKLEDIVIGDDVLTPKGYATVVNKYDHGIQYVYEVILENGMSIKSTLMHKFLCEDGKLYPLFRIIENGLKIMCQKVNYDA